MIFYHYLMIQLMSLPLYACSVSINIYFSQINIIIIMLEQGKSLFLRYVKSVRSQQHWAQILHQECALIDYKRYNMVDFTPKMALQTYQSQVLKYGSNKQPPKVKRWSTIQKKLFIWFAITYAYFQKKYLQQAVMASQIVQKFDMDLLAKIFFSRSTIYLRFHLYSILKSHKQVIWTQQQDWYLSNAVKNNKQIKWNNVSIDIFFKTNGTIFINSKQCMQRWHYFYRRKINRSLLAYENKFRFGILSKKDEEGSRKHLGSQKIIKANKLPFLSSKRTRRKMILREKLISIQLQNLEKQGFICSGKKTIQDEAKITQTVAGQRQNEQVLQFQSQQLTQVIKQSFSQSIIYENNTIYPFSSFDYQMQICNYNTDLYQMHKDICIHFQPNFALIFPQHSLSEIYPDNI